MDRRAQILYAAEIIFREKGFHKTSIAEISLQADISVGLIYNYYKNKEAIIEALVMDIVQRMKKLLNADFENIARMGVKSDTLYDILPPELESSIILLMEISSEATRNQHIRQLMIDAWHDLKRNFIEQEKVLHPAQDTGEITTRLYVMSLIIDGIIIRRCMKQHDISAAFIAFFDTVANKIYPHSTV